MQLSKAIHKLEDWLLAGLALAFVGLAGAQVGVRFFIEGGWHWADSIMKSMVLWIIMLGALAAARESKHLSMDALQHSLTGTPRKLAICVSMLTAAAACVFATKFAFDFVQLERATPSDAQSVIASWKVLVILPLAFAGMALRFFRQAIWVWLIERDKSVSTP